MDSKQAEKIKKIWGWTDEELKCLAPKNQKLIEKGDQFRLWRLVAEVLETKNCIAGLKEGASICHAWIWLSFAGRKYMPKNLLVGTGGFRSL